MLLIDGLRLSGSDLAGSRSRSRDLRQSKVENFCTIALGYEDVRRLDVAVDDPLGVGGVKCIERVTNCEVFWKVPNAFSAIAGSIDRGSPVVLQEGSEIIRSYRGLAATLSAESVSNLEHRATDDRPQGPQGREGSEQEKRSHRHFGSDKHNPKTGVDAVGIAV
jgi:hypothetical protein